MFSLRSLFPSRYHDKTSREVKRDDDMIAEKTILVQKKAELHQAAKEFEATVKDFLNDRDRVEAKRHER